MKFAKCVRPSLWVLTSCILLGNVRCMAGSRSTVRFQEVTVKVSTSPYLEVNKNVKHMSDNLQVIKTFSYSKRIWGVLYSFLTLTDTSDFAQSVNRAVQENRADGIVNFQAEVVPCASNNIIILNMLPIFPGCTILTIKGDLVRRK